MMKEEKTKGGRSKARPAVSWLRRTEYMGTDLYDAVHKVRFCKAGTGCRG